MEILAFGFLGLRSLLLAAALGVAAFAHGGGILLNLTGSDLLVYPRDCSRGPDSVWLTICNGVDPSEDGETLEWSMKAHSIHFLELPNGRALRLVHATSHGDFFAMALKIEPMPQSQGDPGRPLGEPGNDSQGCGSKACVIL